MTKEQIDSDKILDNLTEIKLLLRHLIAIELYRSGATQDEIAANMKVAKLTVNKMVKGARREKTNDE